MHMVAARLDCEKTMVGTGWATSCSDYRNYSHLVARGLVSGKAWAVSVATDSDDYCMVVNKWAWSKS